MRIMIDAHLSGERLTGIGRYLNGLISGLIEEDRENEYIVLVSDRTGPDHPLRRLNAVHFSIVPVRLSGPSPAQQWMLPPLCRRYQADLYHHPHFDLPALLGTPSVMTVHDLKYIRNPDFLPRWGRVKAAYMKKALLHSLRKAVKVIAVSESTKADLVSMCPPAEKKTVVIHHGWDMHASFPQDEKAVLLQYGIHGRYILCVGERRPHKNLPRLIAAFKPLLVPYPDLALVIAGKSYSDYHEPEAAAEREKITEKVIFTEYLPDEILSVMYRHAEILILPSLYEGFGLPLVEAMGYGIPVAGSDNSAVPEIIGDAGLLFDALNVEQITECMLRILDDGKLRASLIGRGKHRVREFSWKNVARSTLALYRSVLHPEPGP